MHEHEPPDDVDSEEMHLFLKPLLTCLHNEQLPGVNDTSPFPLVASPLILYNVALNEVLSLSFDGIIAVKALYSPHATAFDLYVSLITRKVQ